MIDGQQKYCLIQTDALPVDSTSNVIPLVDFGDFDRNSMIDMIYYHDNQVYTFYNKFSANSASDTSLCKGSLPVSDYKNKTIFSLFSQVGADLDNIVV